MERPHLFAVAGLPFTRAHDGVFIHISPMLLTHALRWADPRSHGFAICGAPATTATPPDCGGSVSAWTLLRDATTFFYVPWILTYYVVTFLLLGDYLKSNRYQTLTIESRPRPRRQGHGERLRAHRRPGDLAKRAVYMLSHLLFGVLTMSLAALHWHSYVAHSAFAIAICSASAWNASSYYFTHFAVKYEANIADQVRRASVRYTS